MKNTILLVSAGLIVLSGCTETTPSAQLINQKASLPTSFSISDQHQKVLSSMINRKDSTTSILYGDASAELALNPNDPSKAASFAFTLVTWRQQADPHWFGAKIPGDLISVERLSKKSQDIPLAYQKLSGKTLKMNSDTTGNAARINFILTQKPLIIP